MTDLRHVGQLLHRVAVDERLGTTALAAGCAPDPRRRRGRWRRGAHPAAGVRRRRRAGPDDPPQQGPRVPDRHCPFLWDTIWRDDKWSTRSSSTTTTARARSTSRSKARLTPRMPRVRARRRTARSSASPTSRLRARVTRRSSGGPARAIHARRRSAASRSRARRTAPYARAPTCRPTRTQPNGSAGWGKPRPGASRSSAVTQASSRGGSSPRRPIASFTARFDREIDRRWRRVLQRDHRRDPRSGRDERAGGAATRRRGARRAATAAKASDEEAALRDVPSLLGDMPGGTRVGTFVHHLLEASTSLRPTSSSSSSPRWRASSPAARSTWAIQPRCWRGCVPRNATRDCRRRCPAGRHRHR